MVFQKPGSGIKGELCWLVEGECSNDNSNPAPPVAPPPPHPTHQGIKDTLHFYTWIDNFWQDLLVKIKSFEDLTFSAIWQTTQKVP